MADDEELVRRVKDGDRTAWRLLYDRYLERVYVVVRGRLSGELDCDVEEVVQEVFVQVFRSAHTFRGDAQVSTWIHRIATNTALTFLRAKRAKMRTGVKISLDDCELACGKPDPLRRAIKTELLKRAWALLNKITKKQLAVYVLHEFHGKTVQEIADAFGIPLETARSRLRLARESVRTLAWEQSPTDCDGGNDD